MNNILWSVQLALNRLRTIFRITLITFIVIITGDFLLIPLYAAKGAAIVYLLATLAEYINYMRSSSLASMKETWVSPFYLSCIRTFQRICCFQAQ